jgi:hypothetical protein
VPPQLADAGLREQLLVVVSHALALATAHSTHHPSLLEFARARNTPRSDQQTIAKLHRESGELAAVGHHLF